ncbi:MAG: hypothetical protein K5770_11490 [Lachnospiraceae bacterium]|nr:hypothetical protein [Lachnospiraceae bacterium]
MILKEQKELGIKNVIVMHVPRRGPTGGRRTEREALDRYEGLKQTRGVFFMDDLLRKFEAAPIYYEKKCKDDAFVIHTSGTTTGKRKSVPVSDQGLNETARRMLADPRFADLRNNVPSGLFMALSRVRKPSWCRGIQRCA